MPSRITDNMRVYSTRQFINSLSDTDNTLYLVFGKPKAWSNEASPDSANTSLAEEFLLWQNVIGAKRILGGDAINVIRRYDWQANTVYPHFDYGSEVKNYYVMTDEYNVYKCLSNNRGAQSTTKPTYTGTSISQTGDGYTWKYMYTVSAGDLTRFLTDNYIPVRTLSVDNGSQQWDVQDEAVDGAIHAIEVVDVGSGYTGNTAVISITGNGESANGFASINTTSQTVSSIVLTSYGSGYSNATATITGNASLKVLLGPKGGHGADPIYELDSTAIMLNVRLEADEDGKLPVIGEYRQLAIIQNPTVSGTSNTVASNTALALTTDVTVTGSGFDFQNGEFVYQGTSIETASFIGVVVEWDSVNSIVKLTNTTGTVTSDTLFGANSSAGRFVADVKNPDINLRSGNLLYINNIEPVTRNTMQTEDYRIVINF